MEMMKAAVVRRAGGPEVLRVETMPIPTAVPGQILIRVRAAGLNRSELFTRRGLSPNVAFPRVLGIELVGEVADAPGGEFPIGTRVASVTGGLGRAFDGGYAEYALVPAANLRVLTVDLPWATLGALPEMLQTAWGSLFRALRIVPGDRLLIRGGTTSVGMAAAAIAKRHGATVYSTTRRADRGAMLREVGADHVIVDTGAIADTVRAEFGGMDKVLELVGTTTLLDSLQTVQAPGMVCMTGMVGDAWTIAEFSPIGMIPTGVGLTSYDGGITEFNAMPFDDLLALVADGTLPVRIGRTFALDEIVDAHRLMEANGASGKIVVLM